MAISPGPELCEVQLENQSAEVRVWRPGAHGNLTERLAASEEMASAHLSLLGLGLSSPRPRWASESDRFQHCQGTCDRKAFWKAR